MNCSLRRRKKEGRKKLYQVSFPSKELYGQVIIKF